MKYIAAAQSIFLVAVLAALAIGAALFVRWLNTRGVMGAAQDLKENTPLGIPARAIDSTISAATGREETLGGALADWLNPVARTANAEIDSWKQLKPTGPIDQQQAEFMSP